MIGLENGAVAAWMWVALPVAATFILVTLAAVFCTKKEHKANPAANSAAMQPAGNNPQAAIPVGPHLGGHEPSDAHYSKFKKAGTPPGGGYGNVPPQQQQAFFPTAGVGQPGAGNSPMPTMPQRPGDGRPINPSAAPHQGYGMAEQSSGYAGSVAGAQTGYPGQGGGPHGNQGGAQFVAASNALRGFTSAGDDLSSSSSDGEGGIKYVGIDEFRE